MTGLGSSPVRKNQERHGETFKLSRLTRTALYNASSHDPFLRIDAVLNAIKRLEEEPGTNPAPSAAAKLSQEIPEDRQFRTHPPPYPNHSLV